MSGGYVGVDVFFAISGYLITTILLSDMDAGRSSLLHFYERRARRILPALFFVMAACIPFAWAFMLQTQLKDFFESLAATALFSSNFLFWSESGTSAAVAAEKPLLQTWSLALKEQCYLLFPPLLWLAMMAGRRAALGLIVLGGAASLATALFADMEPESRFFLTHVRVWETLVGSLCAWIMLYRPVPRHGGLALLGLALILVAIFTHDHDTAYPHFAILPVLGTALLIGGSHSKGLFNAFYQPPELSPGLEVRRIAPDFDCFSEQDGRDCVAVLTGAAPHLLEHATHVAFAARWHRPNRLDILDTMPDWFAARSVPVVLVGNTAEYDSEGPVIVADIARDIAYDGTAPFPVDLANAEFYAERSALSLATNARMRELASRLGVRFLDRYGLVCDDVSQRCTGVTPQGKAVTYDCGHWTLAGSRFFGRRIAKTGWLDLPGAPPGD